MGRKENRIQKKIEQNPIGALTREQMKLYPELFQKFDQVTDLRHQSYTRYTNREMLGEVYYKNILSIKSMQEMTEKFTEVEATENMYRLLGTQTKEFVPHYVTVNEYLKNLESAELQKIMQGIVKKSIRRKTFDEAKFLGKWLVIVDGTQLDSGKSKNDEQCLERHYNKGTEEEIVNYYHSVLEAKIYFGNTMIISIASEFVENNSEDAKRQKNMNVEELKQDCETKAFMRLAKKLKKEFTRLPICLLADSLYASENVMEECRDNGWDFIIRYKKGSIPSIAEEYEAIPEKEKVGPAEYVNDIDYRKKNISLLRYTEAKVETTDKRRKNQTIKKESKIVKTTKFQWLTNIRITAKNAEEIAKMGRIRWKIENEGFNSQKNWRSDITHACSKNYNALKCHYLMVQIADFFRQLYETMYLKKHEIKKDNKKYIFGLASQLCTATNKRRYINDKSGNAEHSHPLI